MNGDLHTHIYSFPLSPDLTTETPTQLTITPHQVALSLEQQQQSTVSARALVRNPFVLSFRSVSPLHRDIHIIAILLLTRHTFSFTNTTLVVYSLDSLNWMMAPKCEKQERRPAIKANLDD